MRTSSHPHLPAPAQKSFKSVRRIPDKTFYFLFPSSIVPRALGAGVDPTCPGLLLSRQWWTYMVQLSKSPCPESTVTQHHISTERMWTSTPHLDLKLSGSQTPSHLLSFFLLLCWPFCIFPCALRSAEGESQGVLVKATPTRYQNVCAQELCKAPGLAWCQAPGMISGTVKYFPNPSPHLACAWNRLLTGSIKIQGELEEVLSSSRYKVLSITA